MANSTGKVVVITGASAGIGRAAALAFARAGAAVALVARSKDGLQGAMNDIQAIGGTAIALPADVADPAQIDAVAERVEQVLGPIDVWVNNAMVTVFSWAKDMTAEEYRRVTEVTYLGTVHGTLSALKVMRPRQCGTIIQVGSALAYRGIPLQSAYCAAKFAIRGFTDSLRTELLHENLPIHLTMVQLAAFNTPQFDWARNHMGRPAQPLPPIFQPELAARAIVWSANHKRREIYVGFPALKTILGNKFFPHLADKMAARQGVDGQQDDPTASKNTMADNLFTTPTRGHRTHGRFDKEARTNSWQFMASIHRNKLVLIVAVLVFILMALWW
jgi:NAD(P)-dependent dehydrogenase (short-subunit alcohol dehydrogenase family)